MGQYVDLFDKVKRYFRFTAIEFRAVIIAILTMAFIISFNNWGPGNQVDIAYGIKNFFTTVLICLLVFGIYHSSQRIAALYFGYRLEYKLWTLGIGVGILVAMISFGKIWILVPGAIFMHLMPGHRLGQFRYEHNIFSGMITAWGPIITLFFAIAVKGISILHSNELIRLFIYVAVAYCFTNMLPIPSLDGSKAVFATRMGYAFLMSFVIGASILLLLPIPARHAFWGSIVIAIIAWFLYYVLLEETLWGGP
jgi:hypothetical protein